MRDLGLYVHLPFCLQRCPYCSFTAVADRPELHERYVAAVCRELEMVASQAGSRALDTVFLGGGTPSLLHPDQLARILRVAAAEPGICGDAEITIEVNPGTADQRRFDRLREIGVNRLSLGMQSFDDGTLRRLGRVHSAAQGRRAYALARQAGFDNLNFDLIFSVPGMPPDRWQSTVEEALELNPEHFSTYALVLEAGATLAQRDLPPVAEEQDAQTYEWTIERLTQAGYEQYEVSNFARPGRRCRHNWGCWTGAEYLGVGLAAHSFMAGRRRWNLTDLEAYIERVEAGQSPGADGEEIDPLTALREWVWMGLRTVQGIQVEATHCQALEGARRFVDLQEAGYVELSAGWLRLTRRGLLLADAIGVEIAVLLENGLACPPGSLCGATAGRPLRSEQLETDRGVH